MLELRTAGSKPGRWGARFSVDVEVGWKGKGDGTVSWARSVSR